jgi:hypothetical protein
MGVLADAYGAWKKAMKKRKDARTEGDKTRRDADIEKAFKDLTNKYFPYQNGMGDKADEAASAEMDLWQALARAASAKEPNMIRSPRAERQRR